MEVTITIEEEIRRAEEDITNMREALAKLEVQVRALTGGIQARTIIVGYLRALNKASEEAIAAKDIPDTSDGNGDNDSSPE